MDSSSKKKKSNSVNFLLSCMPFFLLWNTKRRYFWIKHLWKSMIFQYSTEDTVWLVWNDMREGKWWQNCLRACSEQSLQDKSSTEAPQNVLHRFEEAQRAPGTPSLRFNYILLISTSKPELTSVMEHLFFSGKWEWFGKH